MKAQETSSQKAHSFGGTALGNSQQGAEVQREPAHSLLECRPHERVVEGEGAQKPCVQAVERVVATVIIRFQPIG
jgi:hypothetical protein